jgi:transposase
VGWITVKGRAIMEQLITSLNTAVPQELRQVITLGPTLKKRAADILAYFDRPGISNGPTEAINGLIELARRGARGFRDPDNYRLRMLLIGGGLRL